MTNEEALSWFQDDLKNGKCSDECPQCNAMEKAIEALEKQIPKKPIKRYVDNLDCTNEFDACPSCGGFGCIDEDYCPDCGQALDWSDTE
ncbi:MAG: hypothetical protein ACI4J7_00300 [Ruminiclostridium sp.]